MLLLLLFISGLIHYTLSQDLTKLNTPDVQVAFAPAFVDDSLYFLNFVTFGEQADIFRLNTRDGVFYAADIIDRNSPSFIIPIRKKCEKCKKLFAVASGHDVEVVEWNGKATTARVVDKLFSLEANDALSRINYGRTDSHGRLYLGTTSVKFCSPTPNSSFYRYIAGKGITRLFSGIYSTSGIAINEEEEELYHLDACSLLVTAFKWDPSTGDICDGRVAYDFKWIGKVPGLFVPVGMDIGANGLLYISDYNKSIYVINPKTRSVVDVLDVDQQGIAGVAFAGPDQNRLYLVGGSGIVNVPTATITPIPFSGTSIYVLNGLPTTGLKPTYLNIH